MRDAVTLSSAQAQRGTTITVSGDNFNVFRPVTIEIDGSHVAPSATTTDGTGSFSAEVRVPGLSLGNKNLKVSVNNVPVVEFLEIVPDPGQHDQGKRRTCSNLWSRRAS